MDGHGSAPVRSRSSRSPSPSHSHSPSASASASSSAHHHPKRKFSAVSPATAAAAAAAFDTETPDDNDDSEEELPPENDDDDEDEDTNLNSNNGSNGNNDFIRNFTSARLARTVKQERDVGGLVKVEPGGGDGMIGVVKEERVSSQTGTGGSVGLASGIVVKEENGKGIFTENIRMSGAYTAREEGLKRGRVWKA